MINVQNIHRGKYKYSNNMQTFHSIFQLKKNERDGYRFEWKCYEGNTGKNIHNQNDQVSLNHYVFALNLYSWPALSVTSMVGVTMLFNHLIWCRLRHCRAMPNQFNSIFHSFFEWKWRWPKQKQFTHEWKYKIIII